MSFKIVTAATAIGAVLISFIGIFISLNQNRIAKKQYVFNERLKIFTMSTGIRKLVDENQKAMIPQEDDYSLNDIDFANLTNNSDLYELSFAIDDIENSDNKVLFLTRISEIKDFGFRSTFLFKKDEGVVISKYLICYCDMLFARYQLEIFDKKITSENLRTKLRKKVLTKLNETVKDLSAAHEIYVKNEKKIKKEISYFK